ncbi:uncharacterized protein LOC130981395 [Arachis stenosperma]|uniref:uncharacterized protein LOC130981395 n=1 Tax=Arachis stenosperma TaxID=217475 RepID=UPI0025ABDC7E|nr:uncharacterized protein LOC130981395 [Arachis stenosperma]
MGAPAALSSHHNDFQIFRVSGDGVLTTSCPFCPPCSKPKPDPQTSTNSTQNLEIPMGDGIIKQAKLSVREAMERPNGRRIILKFNSKLQPIGDKAGLLSGILGLVGVDYEKFSICEKSWHKITTKDKVYNKCVKQIFYFDEDSEGTIKKNILKSMGKSWKDTTLRLYDAYYDSTLMAEQNIENRPPVIDREHWRWFLGYRSKPKNEMIDEIEQHDESSRVLSQNDSLAQAFKKEKPGRAELEAEKLKRNAMEDETTTEKKKRQAIESALRYLFQRQGEELPLDIAAEINSVEG